MLCEQMKAVRKLNKFTQQQTADALGIERSTYASYETGRNRPDVSLLEKFAKIFGVTVDFILKLDPSSQLCLCSKCATYKASDEEALISQLNSDEQNFIALYRLCPESNKEEIKALLKSRSAANKSEKHK